MIVRFWVGSLVTFGLWGATTVALAELPQIAQAQANPTTFTGQLDETSNILEDGNYFNLHTFEGRAGENLTFELNSEDFDAHLLLLDPSGEILAEDSDAGELTNAVLTVELPTTASYTIVVGTDSRRETGEYTLVLRQSSEVDLLLERANILNAQAFELGRNGHFIEAESFYREALEIRELYLGEQHPDTALTLDSLALLNKTQNRYEEALSFYARALIIFREYQETIEVSLQESEVWHDLRTPPPLLPSSKYFDVEPDILQGVLYGLENLIAYILSDMADIYLIQGDIERAESYREECSEGSFYFEHEVCIYPLSIVGSLIESINLSIDSKDYDKAVYLLREAINTENREIVNESFVFASDSERASYIQSLLTTTNLAISLDLGIGFQYPELSYLAAHTIAKRKGLLLEMEGYAMRGLRSFATFGEQSISDEEVLLSQLARKRSELASLYYASRESLNSEQYRNRVADLEADIDQIETQLRNSRDILNFVDFLPVTPEAFPSDEPYDGWPRIFYGTEFDPNWTNSGIPLISERIPSEGVLVEYIRYRPFRLDESGNPSSSPRYAAYLLFPNGRVESIDLGDAADIDTAVISLSNGLANVQAVDEIHRRAQELDALVMAPLREQLEGVEHLLISPDGALNQIPFEVLRSTSSQYLIETFEISYLTSGRDLLNLDSIPPSSNPPLILAAPNYGEIVAAAPDSTGQRSVDLATLTVGPLQHAFHEGQALSALLPDANFLTGRDATETALKQSPAPGLLHIATHGLFLEDAPRRQAVRDAEGMAFNDTYEVPIENPLLRAMLALEGFNARKSGQEDGILTALEAASLNLYGTQLVVLSACETAQGEVVSGEGVYGLRRAFTLAGAESLVMSLWRVEDEGTQDLMVRYYENLLSGMGRSEALRLVQLEMIQAGDQYSHPYYWAAFVLTGDWRPLKQ
ncbi:CHAT domain-containing tetratricopeptide repeat protein [Halomicronema sp. CCY15110]|uniref:CHAT domain-containing protein n=1 Tax=Halomicronema sp. CCY15110 TaxID=2767773 RepID=UPI00195011CE|nr:CHAT domain-containing tetratricopeptide repeat protein [Halomicronema sp. CCY15110]